MVKINKEVKDKTQSDSNRFSVIIGNQGGSLTVGRNKSGKPWKTQS